MPACDAGTRIPLSSFNKHFGSLVELSSVALGAKVEDVSDDFFAEASNLLKVSPPKEFPDQYGPRGSLMDGWESRRHCEKHDWAIVKLGAVGAIVGVDIDTGHFDGNEAPAVELWGARIPPGESFSADSPQWSPLLPRTPLGPAQRHLLLLASPSAPVTHLKLTMHPDGGIGRLRAYGTVLPVVDDSPLALKRAVDLASALEGGRVVATSDERYGGGYYLTLPGRGYDMEDGWHTRRSRGRLGTDEGDWLVLELGEPGHLEWVDLDTKDFIGNFPREASLEATVSDELVPSSTSEWTNILARQRFTADAQHILPLNHADRAWTHVRLNIYPDGGLKRLRLYGRRAEQVAKAAGGFVALPPLPRPAEAEYGLTRWARKWWMGGELPR